MAEKHDNWQLADVPVDKMKPGSNVRKDARESELPALGESLLVRQYHPVILDLEFVIVDGWRRWLAAQRVGLKTL
ncbi:MAG TPA: ParB N-terminal domain-containing protein, partial [Pirellulaceae bacterium]